MWRADGGFDCGDGGAGAGGSGGGAGRGGAARPPPRETFLVPPGNVSPTGYSVTTGDPGVLVEKRYGAPADRYGVGQYGGGNMRVYTAGAFRPASLSLSYANGEEAFDDVVRIVRAPDGAAGAAGYELQLNNVTTLRVNGRAYDVRQLQDQLAQLLQGQGQGGGQGQGQGAGGRRGGGRGRAGGDGVDDRDYDTYDYGMGWGARGDER